MRRKCGKGLRFLGIDENLFSRKAGMATERTVKDKRCLTSFLKRKGRKGKSRSIVL